MLLQSDVRVLIPMLCLRFATNQFAVGCEKLRRKKKNFFLLSGTTFSEEIKQKRHKFMPF